jgi:mRNA-degrading endonuclease YafQ of YafQ-DinJ toxin-antitoxin module
MKYTVKPTSRFRKDYKLMEKRNLDMSLLDEIIAKSVYPASLLIRCCYIGII